MPKDGFFLNKMNRAVCRQPVDAGVPKIASLIEVKISSLIGQTSIDCDHNYATMASTITGIHSAVRSVRGLCLDGHWPEARTRSIVVQEHSKGTINHRIRWPILPQGCGV